MMSIKLKIKTSKKSLAKLVILLVFLVSYPLFLVKANSQSDKTSNSLGYVFLIFSVVVIVLTILTITKNPVADFLLKNYKFVIIALIVLFLLIYFIPQISITSITGLFVVSLTTTTSTTTVVNEEVSQGLIQTFSEMQPGKINIMKISGEGVDLTELNLEVYNNLKNVKIVVSKLTSKPTSTMQDPSGNLYQYLKIEKTNIKDEDLKKVVIKFKVSKSWINENKIDESTISLNRYENNVWIGLSTAKTNEDNDFSYYETYTVGLSFFAITGNSIQPQGATATTTTIVTTTTTTVLIGPLEETTTTETTTTVAGTSTTTMPVTTTTIPHYDCKDSGTECTMTTFTKTYPDGSAMTVNYQEPINFFDETSNTYQQINQTITELPSNHPLYSYGYRYGTEKGIYKVYFKPDMGQDWEIGLNVSNIILRYDLQRTAYLDYSDMKYRILQTPSTDSVALNVNEMNHTGVFTGVDIQYRYLPQKLKENLILNQTFRNNAPDPRNFGMQPATTYLIAEAEFDYKDLTPYVDDTEQTGNFTTENKIKFKDALGNVKFFLPIGYAVDSQVNDLGIPNNTQKVRWRIEHRGGKHYLLYGIPVLWLNSAQYPVTIDPTGEIPFTQEIDHYSLQNDLNDYYFNATDAQQMINHFQDYWSKNEICMGFYIGRWREYCTDAIDWTWYNSTDYSSYVNLTGVAEAFYGKDWYQKTSKYGVRVTLEHYLTSDSPEIRVSVKLENIGQNDIPDTYMKIWAHDIRVNTTAENDTFRVNTTSFWEPWSGYSEYWLNNTSLSLSYTQNDLVSRKFAVFDNSTESWIEMEWNDSYWKNGMSNSMNYNLSVKKESETNAPVDLVLLTGQFNRNDVISTNFKWADAVKQNFNSVNASYGELIDWLHNEYLEAYTNGKETYLLDINLTMEIKPDGIAKHTWGFDEYKNFSSAYAFRGIAPKFSCFYHFPYNKVYCPENWTNEIGRDFMKEEIERMKTGWNCPRPIMRVDNQIGDLITYEENQTPPENQLFRKGRVNLPYIFDTETFKQIIKFSINYSYTGTSHCVAFSIPMYANITINVTMLSPIANYTFGREEFIIENYTQGNSAIAKIRVYPCCGITGVTMQTAEVCSE